MRQKRPQRMILVLEREKKVNSSIYTKMLN